MRIWVRLLFLVAAMVYSGFAQTVDFARDIDPILRKRCFACHGSVTQMSGLRLDSREAALKGGSSGAVLTPGNSSTSKLFRLVSGSEGNKVMPPSGPRLSAQEVDLFRLWIDQGATWPATTVSATKSQPVHWSFQPIGRPAPPRTRNETWGRNAIDRFVLARLEREGIEPSPETDRRTLIRRVSFDLTGLPPTPDDVDAFLRDNRPDAYEHLVDRLFQSPHFGERWARHWLDLARYADSDGYEKDYVRPNAWRWRHWVIDAFNEDKPFDRFTIEQIAGDLLPGATVDQKMATGFHRNTLTNREGGVNIEQFRVEQVVDRASTIGTVWLGLTVGCAQCHDHKYDPIRQKEFYQLYAFFNSADEDEIDAPLSGEMGPFLENQPVYRKKRQELLKLYRVSELQVPWEVRMKEARANPGKWTDWDHAYDAFQKYLDHADRILDTPVEKRSQKWQDSITDHFVINYHRVIDKEQWKSLKFVELRKKLNELREQYPALSEAPIIAENPASQRISHIHIRGDWKQKGVEVQPDVPAFLPPLTSKNKTRVDLAQWLVAPNNPLPARVAVNRFWQELFSRGLVRTSDDFGAQGEKPSHPELLDWLAGQFVDSGWRVKALLRQIVTSATYRQSSHSRAEIDARDPGNALLSRQSRLRLPSESVRDAALSVSELLYPAIGGKSVRPPIPQGVVDLSYSSSVKWSESSGKDRYRRGLYILFQRTVPYPMLMNFDQPDASTPSCKRERSNTPLQALNLLNDPVFVEAAQALAVKIQVVPAKQRIDRIYEICLARNPSPREREWMNAYLEAQIALFRKDPSQAGKMFPMQVMNEKNVEGAAWTALASVLLNLDEFITRE